MPPTGFAPPPTTVTWGAAEMAERFTRYPGAVETAAVLGSSLAFGLDLLTPRLPDFPMPGGFVSEDVYLRHLVIEGARTVYAGDVLMASIPPPWPVSSTSWG